ncbi:MAG: PmoA family protein [Gemmataceae bacterium]
MFPLLFAGLAAAAPPALTATKTDTAVEFRLGDELVTRYVYAGTVRVEKGDGEKPLAKPFFYPLTPPGGPGVTRGWPMARGTPGETTDHFHQKSVWFCHGDVEPGWVKLASKSADRRAGGVDFWSEAAGHGRIVCVQVGDPKPAGPSRLTVPTRNEWRTADGLKLLDEDRTITVSALPAGVLIVVDVTLTASQGPVTFGDTKEGSMGVRVHDAMRLTAKGGGTITSSDGTAAKSPAKDNLPVWGRPADWNDYSGTVDGKPVGLAVFDDPANRPRASWHTRAYGLMAANPFGRAKSGFPSQKGNTELVTLAKGQTLRLRYGVYAHTGDAASGKVAEAFAAFAAGK